MENELPRDVRLRRSRWVPLLSGWLSGMGGPAAAVTVGRTILLHPGVAATEALLRHELAHVRQWRRYGLSFPFRYALSHLRHGYHDNPFEVEAREAEGRDPRC